MTNEKETILEYVRETPHNTNPSVVKSLLNNIQKGTPLPPVDDAEAGDVLALGEEKELEWKKPEAKLAGNYSGLQNTGPGLAINSLQFASNIWGGNVKSAAAIYGTNSGMVPGINYVSGYGNKRPLQNSEVMTLDLSNLSNIRDLDGGWRGGDITGAEWQTGDQDGYAKAILVIQQRTYQESVSQPNFLVSIDTEQLSRDFYMPAAAVGQGLPNSSIMQERSGENTQTFKQRPGIFNESNLDDIILVGYSDSEYVPFDPKYIPDSVKPVTVWFTADYNNNFTCNYTHAQLKEMTDNNTVLIGKRRYLNDDDEYEVRSFVYHLNNCATDYEESATFIFICIGAYESEIVFDEISVFENNSVTNQQRVVPLSNG